MDVNSRILEFVSAKGLSIAEFERLCGLSNGYVRKVKNSLGKRGLSDILRKFPELNSDWLLTGKGEMLNPSISQSVNGSHNTTVAGNGNQVNVSALIEELAAQRKLTEKAQEQVDRLLSLMEKMYK